MQQNLPAPLPSGAGVAPLWPFQCGNSSQGWSVVIIATYWLCQWKGVGKAGEQLGRTGRAFWVSCALLSLAKAILAELPLAGAVHPSVENQSWARQISFQVVAYAGNRVKKTLLTNLLIKPWILGNEGGLETQLIFHFYKLGARANPGSNFYFCFLVLQCLLWKDSWDHLSESLALAAPILVLF